MFKAPEGERLFIYTEVRKAVATAGLFMTPDEMALIQLGLDVCNQKTDELFDEACERGWKPSGDDATAHLIEDRAAIFTERTVQGWKEACEKLDTVVMSQLQHLNKNNTP
jgi:hypothetical protein